MAPLKENLLKKKIPKMAKVIWPILEKATKDFKSLCKKHRKVEISIPLTKKNFAPEDFTTQKQRR